MKNKLSTIVFLVLVVGTLFTSCVAKRKYLSARDNADQLRADSVRLASELATQADNISNLQKTNTSLQQQIGTVQRQMDSSNRQAAGQLAQSQRRLETLQALIDQQRKTTSELRQKMTDALKGFNSNELSVSVKNGKVYVSLQENLLFPSGSAVVNPKGKQALGKLAGVLTINPDINVNIEGHTDSIPIRARYEDNWALSVARATSIVRILTKDYGVEPLRIIASGHSQYDPVDSNMSQDGRAKNRRTEIILSPKLDELYKIIEQGG
ncbi:MAG: OmpA family protein [Chitinophagaceae bacterium]|nr:OmpA family protein [Chitinophagaceae bacterium]